jgi:type I restriction enzyme S subunit
MTKKAQPKAQAPKGRNNSALGNAPPEGQSPEGAGQISSATHNKGWRNTTLGAVITSIDTGKSFRCEERPPNESEVGVVKVSAVTWGTYDEEESKTCLDAARIEPRYLIEEGDFLFSRANTIQLIGACVIAGATSRRLMLSDKILRFRFTGEVEPKWVLHWLRSKQGRSEIERLSSGNQESMRNIGQERIRAIALPLPLPDDQRRIVAEIEKQFTRLEAGVAALRRVQANLKRYRAAVLKAACEGRLVPTEAEFARTKGRPFESGQQLLARILTERRQNWQGRGKYKEPTAPDSTTLPLIPDGWTWASFDQITTLITKGSSPNWQGFNYCDNGIIFVRSENVRWGTIDLDGVAHLPPAFNENAAQPAAAAVQHSAAHSLAFDSVFDTGWPGKSPP